MEIQGVSYFLLYISHGKATKFLRGHLSHMKTTKTTQMFLPPLKQKPHGGRTQPPGAHSVFCRESSREQGACWEAQATARRPVPRQPCPVAPTPPNGGLRNRVKHSEIRRLSKKNSKRERGAKGKQGARRGERRGCRRRPGGARGRWAHVLSHGERAGARERRPSAGSCCRQPLQVPGCRWAGSWAARPPRGPPGSRVPNALVCRLARVLFQHS